MTVFARFTRFLFPLLIGCIIVCTTVSVSNASKPETRFNRILSHLDMGGQVLMVVNMDDLVERFADRLLQMITALPETTNREMTELKQVSWKIDSFLQNNGFYAARGIGISSVEDSSGIHHLKMFVHRDADAISLPFWRSFYGSAPRRMAALDLLPRESGLAWVANMEPDELWRLIRTGILRIAPKPYARQFNARLQVASSELGIAVDDLFASLGEELFFSLQLSREKTIAIPTPNGNIEVPRPSFLIGFAVENESLSEIVGQLVAKEKIPLKQKRIGDTTLYTVSSPHELKDLVKPTYTHAAGHFLIGSDRAVVESAILAAETKDGLVSTKAYQKAFEGMPAANNGIYYVDPFLVTNLSKLNKIVMELSTADATPEESAVIRAIINIFDNAGTSGISMVTTNLEDGVLVEAKSGQRSGEILAGIYMIPIAIMTAMTAGEDKDISRADQREECIKNLKIIAAAKQLWALQNDCKKGELVDQRELVQFFKSGMFPMCPSGGRYEIGPVGTAPSCNIDGHHTD